MPKDFRDFKFDSERIINENPEKTEEYENILNKYKNMSQNDLMTNLITEAKKLKSEGKLDSDSLNNLKSSLAPFLNTNQAEMLNNLIEMIK